MTEPGARDAGKESGKDASKDASKGGTVRRTLDLLLSFTQSRPTLTPRELSDLTGIALPSVYRYLSTLREAGLVVGDERGGYHLSMRLIALAHAAEAADGLIELADPVMRGLAGATGETVLLVKLVGRAAVCVHRIESSHQLRTSYEPGQPLPIEHGASARILLGSMSASARKRVFAEVARTSRAEAARLEADVDAARRDGWATSREEIDRGIWAASAAVHDRDGNVIAALSVPSPLVRAPEESRERLLGQVRTAAAGLTRIVATSDR